MKFKQYGNKAGSLVVYFHGTPGALTECTIFDEYAKKYKLNIICFERFSIDATITEQDYYQVIATAIKQEAKGENIDIIGFSIGCHVAIETSNLLGDSVNNLHLVSAAAPLESGDYLTEMAGGTVFKLAMHYPRLFKALSYWQSLLVRISPKLLFSMIFASANGQDNYLSKQDDFKHYIKAMLISTYGAKLNGYLRDVSHYVKPWQKSVLSCPANTHLWHGSEDNWSPIAMANYLAKSVHNCAQVNTMTGASHYSTLFNCAEKICRQLGKNN